MSPASPSTHHSARWKGKARALPQDERPYVEGRDRRKTTLGRRQTYPGVEYDRIAGKGRGTFGRRAPAIEGSGGNDGVVLPMTMLGGGVYDAPDLHPPSKVILLPFHSSVPPFVSPFHAPRIDLRTTLVSMIREFSGSSSTFLCHSKFVGQGARSGTSTLIIAHCSSFDFTSTSISLLRSHQPPTRGLVRSVSRFRSTGCEVRLAVMMPIAQIVSNDRNYVLPVTVGRNDKPQTFLLQVDTGSSDLWIASTDCTSSECSDITSSSSSTNSVASSSKAMYDPGSSGADSTGADFTISYLQGDVSGPVYWDKVQIGGYGIENQAVAAASSVASEPLSPAFHGILGLALPLNSVIAQSLPPVTSNDPDGAAWASNLFSITPVRNAPARRFVSMLLSRPESDRIPSLLGIGRHPEYITSLPLVDGKTSEARVEYDSLVAERSGTLFWKTGVRAVTVYVQNDGGVTEVREVTLPRAVGGGAFPSAVVDSGVPVILARSQIANAIWGALGIGPAEDGMYYIPCTTPLNLTITLDGRSPIPLHPLDLTALPPLASPGQKGATCVGLIQSADAFLGRPNAIGDMILGVPFLRNVYSVMGYVPPKDGGVFENPFTAEELGVTDEMEAAAVAADGDPTDALPTPKNSSMRIQPRLGLLGLTDPTVALDEFHSVRVLNQPISSNNGNGASGKNPLTADGADGRKGLSVGIIVLISLISFFALCFALFGLRFWMMRRRYNKAGREPNSRSGASTPRPPFYVAGGGEEEGAVLV
ncbi:hypothetical protein D9611_013048 [Ephemerocybe angulata]|uniref:Peptidase A1 domain-containing protein n=1 Tax=Ephemerocybe angulata TaxID=980116 RepID=A0A8H5AUN1_9AGAR|nr:hypothetical protein D9611_013048 [Tulosesus angulatus]